MRSILLCVDGSEYAITAAEYAISLAKSMNAYVDILYVSDVKNFEMSAIADFGGSIGAQPFQEMLTSVTNFEKGKAEILEKKFSKLFIDAGLKDRFKFNYHVGVLVDSIEQFKTDLTGLDLVILGKRGESSSDEKAENIGESIESIIRATSVPCLITQNKHVPLKKVLLAYDGSESSTKAVHFIERNSCFSNCEIHILSVEPDKEIKQNIKEVEALLSKIKGLKVVVAQKRTGEPSEVITKYSDQNKIDLLMIGSFNHNILVQLIAGSTTIDLLEMSKIPMMVFS